MFKELYYWMYYYLQKVKTNDMPAINACFLLGVLQMANICTIYIIFSYVSNAENTADINTSTYFGVGLSIILFILNFFFHYARRKTIIEKYEALPTTRKIKGQLAFWLYTVLSLVVFFTAVANLVEQR